MLFLQTAFAHLCIERVSAPEQTVFAAGGMDLVCVSEYSTLYN